MSSAVHSTAVLAPEPSGALGSVGSGADSPHASLGGGKLSVSPGGWLDACSLLTHPARLDTSAAATRALLTLRMVGELKGSRSGGYR